MQKRMVRPIVFVVLALCASNRAWAEAPAAPSGENVPQQTEKGLFVHKVYLQEGTTVAVRLKNNSKLWGRVSRLSKDHFDLQFLQQDRIETRTISVSEVKSIKLFDPAEKRGNAFFGAGLATGVVVLTFIILAATGVL